MHIYNLTFFNYAHSAIMLSIYNCSKMGIMYEPNPFAENPKNDSVVNPEVFLS